MVIPFTVRVTPKQIRDQFCAAFEGGSNYWLQRAELKSCENKPIAKDDMIASVAAETSDKNAAFKGRSIEHV